MNLMVLPRPTIPYLLSLFNPPSSLIRTEGLKLEKSGLGDQIALLSKGSVQIVDWINRYTLREPSFSFWLKNSPLSFLLLATDLLPMTELLESLTNKRPGSLEREPNHIILSDPLS